MLTVADIKARDKKYYANHAAAIKEKRAAHAAAKAEHGLEKTGPKETILVVPVVVVNGWPDVKTPALDRIKFRLEKEAA